MAGYLFRRLLVSVGVLLGLSVLAFFIVRLAPGDTATAMLGPHYTEQDAIALRERYGLDRPLVVQYATWMSQVVRGDLGQSFTGRSVSEEIRSALPVTLELMATSMCMALLMGLPLGLIAAVRKNTWLDYSANAVGMLGLSVPGFWLGTLLILLFSLKLGWLPSGGFHSMSDPWQNVRHLLLPAAALGAAVAAVVMRMTRTAMMEVLHQDYIRTARGKGVAPRSVVFKHALRNAFIPVITILGLQAGYLIGGSVVIEEVFSLNGIGRLVLRSVTRRDYPTLQACVLLVGSAFLMINLGVDLLYAWLDPRVRLGGDT